MSSISRISQNRVVLIFSQSWSSHGHDVSATDDLRRAAVKLAIKVCLSRKKWSAVKNGPPGLIFK